MKVNEYNRETKIYRSCEDRFVKKINDHIYEVYHINVIENNNVLYVMTINFNELTLEDINHYLNNCGLIYLPKDKKIVQKHNPNEIVAQHEDLIEYILADKLAISGAKSNQNQFAFEDAKDLNEILLEHNIYHQFDNPTLRSL